MKEVYKLDYVYRYRYEGDDGKLSNIIIMVLLHGTNLPVALMVFVIHTISYI